MSPNPPLCGRRRHHPPPTYIVASVSEPPPLSLIKLSAARDFQLSLFAGAIAGFTVDAVLFPLDTLKTRMQLATAAASSAPTGAVSAARQNLLKGLYQGFGPAVAASAPAAAAFFAVYDYTKKLLEGRVSDEKYTPLCHVAAAAAGDVAASTVRVPFEVVKQRMQSGMYATARQAVQRTFATEGVAGFFSGYGSLVLRELPFDAIQFPLFEFLKAQWRKRENKGELATWQTSVCGSVAGGVSAAITTPLDVVKTRLMTQAAGVSKYKGIWHGLTTIAKEEGMGALMAGVTPRVVWISVGGAVFFGALDAAKKVAFPVLATQQMAEDAQRKVE